MKVLIPFLALAAALAWADEKELDMRPGLWKVDMVMRGADGNEVNPAAVIEQAMANLPEEKKKQLMEMMGKAKVDSGAVKVCYTEAMIKNPETIAKQDPNCETTVTSSSKREIKSTFKCKDGATGDAVWKIKNPSEYEGNVSVNTEKTGKSSVVYRGKYVGKDCGEVKPMDGTAK